MLLAKTKLNNLLNNELIDSYINHDEFVSVNNILRWKKTSNFLKMLWNIVHKNNGNDLFHLEKDTEKKNCSIKKTKQIRLITVLLVARQNRGSLKPNKLVD